jgi:bifunctional UDP-N-acetylglucosamine pyrophosphorylase/glucosamine-1-phosphate N-acetyltransferase
VRAVIAAYEKDVPAAAMAVVPVENPEDYGVVEVEKETRVKRIVEKPDREQAPSNLANAGIYLFKPDIFEKVKRTSASARGEWEITDAVQLLVEDGNNVAAVRIDRDDWMDIGRPWDLLEANRWALVKQAHRVLGTVEDGVHLVGPVTVGESARVRGGAYVEGPVFIGSNSDVGPNCHIRPFTSIGKKVRIGNACEIKNSLIMDGVHIGHLSYVGDSVVGERCNLGAGTITANYRLDSGSVKMMVKDKVVDSGKTKLGAILGDDVKTGINTLFMPGVKVGCGSWVGPGVMVVRDLPSKSVTFLKQSLETKEG